MKIFHQLLALQHFKTMANYYMCHAENEIAKTHPELMPTLYTRYVDDIYVIARLIGESCLEQGSGNVIRFGQCQCQCIHCNNIL